VPDRVALNKGGPKWKYDPGLRLFLSGVVSLPNGLADTSAGAGVVPGLRRPAADPLGLCPRPPKSAGTCRTGPVAPQPRIYF
jgi:hypothetical protein